MLRLTTFALAFSVTFCLPSLGQQAPPPTPPQTNIPHSAPLNPALPTVFIVGDSTARNSADLGWGDHFAQFFDTSRINVANRAIAGRSARSYIDEGHWTSVLAEMKSGEGTLIAFATGVALGLLASVIKVVRLKRQLARLRREHHRVQASLPAARGAAPGTAPASGPGFVSSHSSHKRAHSTSLMSGSNFRSMPISAAR